MKTKLFGSVAAAALGLAMSFGATDVNANLLSDAGYEGTVGQNTNDEEAWNGFAGGPATVAIESTVAPLSGLQHLDMTTSGLNAFSGAFQWERGITPGDLYTFSFSARAGVGVQDAAFEYRIEWINAGGGEVSRDQIIIPAASLTSLYQPFSVGGFAPLDAVDAKVVTAIATFPGSTGNVYVDDASLVPEPTSLGLLGLGGLAMLRRKR